MFVVGLSEEIENNESYNCNDQVVFESVEHLPEFFFFVNFNFRSLGERRSGHVVVNILAD